MRARSYMVTAVAIAAIAACAHDGVDLRDGAARARLRALHARAEAARDCFTAWYEAEVDAAPDETRLDELMHVNEMFTALAAAYRTSLAALQAGQGSWPAIELACAALEQFAATRTGAAHGAPTCAASSRESAPP